ncbi:MAG: hypothetical protein EB100_06560, partial [Crocinitomicaceae bacterium]|nr:hypothetical protein [Crocinitomicaceae bacterium]
ATFGWTNNNSSIGLASNGIGDIASFVGTGTKETGVTNIAVIQVTPSLEGCVGTPEEFTLTVRPSDAADFSYQGTSFCLSADANPSPTITGEPNGTFTTSSSDLKLSINGTIDLKNSKTGIYSITYTTNGTCKSDSTIQVSLLDNPTVNPLSDTSVCLGTSVSLPFSGKLGTEFDWKNSNVNIGLPSSGKSSQLNFVASGTSIDGATISSTIIVTPKAGVCIGTSDTFNIKVLPTDNPQFFYDKASYCTSKDGNPVTTISGKKGGVFTIIPLSNALNNSTGEITLNSIATGVYQIKYTTNGKCKNNSTVTIAIGDNPFINSVSDQIVCKESSFQRIDFNGGVGNTFVWSNSTPSIGLAANGIGTISSFIAKGDNAKATITVTPSIGSCVGLPIQFDLTSNAKDNAVFSYAANSYCNKDMNPTPQITGTKGGVFTATPDGLSIDAITGTIDLSKTANNTYTINYVTAGTCGDTATQVIYINSNPTVNAISDLLNKCAGTQVGELNFSGSLGTTFSWKNQNSAIGLALNGEGDIPTFTLQNSSNTAITSMIEVTPKAGSCIGASKKFNIQVY